MSARTEESYVDWIRRFIVWSGKRHPREMGTVEVRGFLTHLAAERNVAAATQNQALNALVFLYREVIGGELGWLDGFEPAKRGGAVDGGVEASREGFGFCTESNRRAFGQGG